MVVVSYSGKEINAKLVYYGPGLSGKTTNLEHIYKSVPQNSRGKMVSMKTRSERTLFFDFLPVDLGQLGGFKTRFLLYTVPGQVYYNATRKLVLRGVDALVFVADSERGKMKENLESLQNLRDNLKDYDLNLDEMPWVIQYNKRDMDDVYSIDELEKDLNPKGVPYYESVAMTGEGVFECFQGVGKVLLAKLSKEIKLEERSTSSRAQAHKAAESAQANATQASGTPSQEAPAKPAQEPVSASSRDAETAQAQKASAQVSPGDRPDPSGPKPGHPAPKKPVSTVVDATEELRRASSESQKRPNQEPAKVLPGPGSQEVASAVVMPVEDKPGFWGRLFGKKPRARLVVMTTPEGASGGEFKEITVPIQLDPKDLTPGTQLRLILNLEVRSSQETKAA